MKIAIITNGPHFSIGGVEKYSSILCEYFGSKHQITEFPTLKIKKNIQQNVGCNPNINIDYSLLGWKPYLIVWGGSYTRKNYKQIFENYDLVIISATFLPAKWIFNPKAIVVQHMDQRWYSLRGKKMRLVFGQFVNSLLFGVGTVKNSFKNASNVVFFANETQAPTKAQNIFFIPLAHKQKFDLEIKKTNRENFAYIGRIDNSQKNIKDLITIANHNKDVLIYGSGHHYRMLKHKMHDLSQYRGILDKKDIDEKMQHLKCLILTSHYEGFPFTIVEALSNGTPVIAFETFNSLKFFAKSKAVFTVPAGNIKIFNQKMAWLRNLNDEEYRQISKNAIEFAKTYLTKQDFWANWENIISKVQSNELLTN